MGGFLRAFIPLGESAGDYLQQRSIANYGNQMRQRQTQALMESFKALGPEGETIAAQIGQGLPYEAATAIYKQLADRKTQQAFADAYAKAGGKLTPDVIKAGLASGAFSGSDVAKLGEQQQSRAADLQSFDAEIAAETDPDRKKFLQSLRPSVVANGLEALAHVSQLAPKESESTLTATDLLSGRTMQYPVKKTATGYEFLPFKNAPPGFVSPEGGVRGKLSQSQQQQVDAVNAADEQTKGLADDYARIQPKYKQNGGSWLLRQWALYSPTTNPGGMFGAADPDAAQWFSHVGQIKTSLLQAAAGNTRNLTLVNQLFGPHVPSEWQSPDAVMARIKAFQSEGRFGAIRQSIIGGGETEGPPAGGSVNLVVPKRKHLGWAPDGREVVEGADGKPVAVSP